MKTKSKAAKKWSGKVNATSFALELEPHIFKSLSPLHIAQSLRRSALNSRRRKGSAFQSAMSMLNFYINRAGRNLTDDRKKILERAKEELRKVFHRNDHK